MDDGEQCGVPAARRRRSASGASYGCNLVGYEFDHVDYNGLTPPRLHVLGYSFAQGTDAGDNHSQATYYVAQLGALVFAIRWRPDSA